MVDFSRKLWMGVALGVAVISLNACKDDEKEPVKEGIQRSELILTEVSGEGVEAHGDHFHGLANAVEGESKVIKFDDKGNAMEGGHLHLEADAIYKIELKAWDHTGKEVQNDFIASKAVADGYKAFLQGGSFVLNPDTEHEDGAIFQPRDQKYGDGTDVAGQYETTGIVSYFTVGHANEGGTVNVAYILRKLNAGVKAEITRKDWNDPNYQTRFAGENVLDLRFEIHAEEGHHH
jgi:hypothetical protein